MSSSFFEFNVAITGLYVAKAGNQVTSHNIANSKTPGYSRQYVKVKTNTPMMGSNGAGMIGTGANFYGVGQHRDFYLDKKYWSQTCTLGEYDTKKSNLDLVETIFNANTDSGINKVMDNFFNKLSSLTFESGENVYRTNVVKYAENIIKSVNTYANELLNQQRDLNEDLETIITKVNTLGKQIADLNRQIFVSESDGSSANDLRDQRALLVDDLSQYVNVEVSERTMDNPNDKRFSVLINGQQFVDHFDYRTLECKERNNKVCSNDAVGLYDIMWAGGTVSFETNGLSGQLKGTLDIRDGDNGINGKDYKGIPYYFEKLNDFVRTFARAMNEGTHPDGSKIDGVTGHINGYDADGEQGNLFFSYKDENGNIKTFNYGAYNPANGAIDYDKMTALNFSLSKELLDSNNNLAAAKQPGGKDDNGIIKELVTLKDYDGLFQEGNMFDYLTASSAELGIQNEQANSFKEYYSDIVSSVDNQRLQVSGVSLNEETINLVKYQQLYQISSKLVSVINEIYNMTINGLGI